MNFKSLPHNQGPIKTENVQAVKLEIASFAEGFDSKSHQAPTLGNYDFRMMLYDNVVLLVCNCEAEKKTNLAAQM